MRRVSSALLALLPFIFFKLRLVLLWQLVPQQLRRKVVSRFIKVPERQASASRPKTAGPPFTIVGFASSETGLGWTTRILKKQLSSGGVAPEIVDVSDRFGAAHRAVEPAGAALSSEPGTLVLNVNPHQIALALAGIPRELLDNKYIVGSFVWELEAIPENWHSPAALVDEIWVPTRFVASAFERAKLGRPIRVVPYQVEVPEGTQAARRRFNIPSDRFVVLVAANTRSGMARKNVEGAIQAFLAAFPDEDHRAVLLVKIQDGVLGESFPERLKQAFKRSDVQIVEQSLDDKSMWDFVASCDVVLSMHRSEGYGLLLKQGLLLGKSVVATGWSGNLDFMVGDFNAYLIDYDLVPVVDPQGLYDGGQGLVWAEPRMEDAVEVLVGLYQKWFGNMRN